MAVYLIQKKQSFYRFSDLAKFLKIKDLRPWITTGTSNNTRLALS